MRYSLFISVIFIFLFNSISWAVFRVGNLRIKSFIGTTKTSESNVYLDSTTAQSTMVRSFSYGIDLYLPVKKHEFEVDYKTEVIDYDENPAKRSFVNNNADVLLKFDFPAGLFFNVTDKYRGNTESPTSEFSESVKYNFNTLIGGIGFRFGQRLSVAVSNSQMTYDYLQQQYKPSLNRKESETNFEISYKLLTKSAILFQYGLGIIKYEFSSDNDSTYSQVAAGLKGRIAPKTSGEFKIGSKSKKYDTIAGKDVSTSIFSFSSLTDFSKMTSMGIVLNRNFVESPFINNLYYVSNGFAVNLTWKSYQFWSLSLNASCDINDYPNLTDLDNIVQKRQDKNVLVGLNLSFNPFGWFFFTGGIGLQQRDSNYNRYSYSDLLSTLGIKIIF